jgi:16S rRNA (cytosine967-C5)-methyltransferase
VSRYHSYLNSAREILALYSGEEPFSSFARKYFAQNKKIGSKDRKQISNLCYCYFRMGKMAPPPPKGGILENSLKIEEKILAGLFLCSDKSNEILEALKPEWNSKTGLSINEKLSSLNYQLSSVFPWKEELSDGIEYEKFCASFFVQPDLFLRIRPRHAEKVLLKLNEAEIKYEFISPFTIRLPNNFKADEYFEMENEVVVQDYNSQRVGEFVFAGQTGTVRPGESYRVWDCCAGSGGKSIMAYDLNPEIKLVVSDLRESILINLRKRFANAGIKNYTSFTIDLSNSAFSIDYSPFDLIIADVPCSGSGTWSRTPEQLYYFDARKIDEYAALQKRIVSNVIPHLRPGGYLLYITCSVFKKENEEMVAGLKEKFHLQLMKMELLKGYQMKADTMFAALLSLPFR